MAYPGKDVEEFPTLAADDGLHVAIQAVIRTAGNPGAILALGAMIMTGPSHFPNLAGTERDFKQAAGDKS